MQMMHRVFMQAREDDSPDATKLPRKKIPSFVCTQEQILRPEVYNQGPPVVGKTERRDQQTNRHLQVIPNTDVSMLAKDPGVLK